MAPDINHVRIMIEIQGRNSPCNRNDKLLTHAAPAIATTTLFLFQMAKLEWSISIYFGKLVVAHLHAEHDQ
jgi:hypothetical protein